jgi:NAD(P)H dehydrogenase (quinone)
MFAITGVTGNVGGELARNLLAAKKPVRAVVRDARKGAEWAGFGCEVAIANIGDVAAMAAAFEGAEGVFVMVPPNFDPLPGFPEARRIAAGLKAALEMARPGRRAGDGSARAGGLSIDDWCAGYAGESVVTAHDY